MLTNAPILAFYDVTKPTAVSACQQLQARSSAAPAPLGRVETSSILVHVSLRSRNALWTDRKGASAGVWACEKFDKFLCGLEEFRLETGL